MMIVCLNSSQGLLNCMSFLCAVKTEIHIGIETKPFSQGCYISFRKKRDFKRMSIGALKC
jgi:hypothetical protein